MATIGFKLDLAMVLVDTTTGRVVTEKGAAFLRNGEAEPPIDKGGGNYIYINKGRENFTLGVKLKGYEDYSGLVDYDKINANLPLFTVFLIPSTQGIPKGDPLVSLSGKLSGLTEIEAVRTSRPGYCINEFKPKKGTMSYFSMNGSRSMDGVNYGIVHVEQGDYEPIEVVSNQPDYTVKLKEPILEEFVTNAPICRIIYGSVDEEGNFLLRLRDSADEIPVILRYCVDDQWYFLQGEFHCLSDSLMQEVIKSQGKEDA
ncbi:MAG: hypothetical protein K6F00_11570 [Lachnospiraceae bacterium]|nr:hypothetical protein [Lachnospiraceae bacterium]